MPLTDFTPNTVIKSSEVDTNFSGLADGSLISTGAITAAKLASDSVTHTKLSLGQQSHVVLTSETTASTSYTDLATNGPIVTVTMDASGVALVIFSASVQNDTGGNYCAITPVISGDTTLAAADDNAILATSGSANQVYAITGIYYASLNSGTNNIEMQYRVSGGTGSFLRRRLVVIPLS